MKTEIRLTKVQFERWLFKDSNVPEWEALVAETEKPEPKKLYAYVDIYGQVIFIDKGFATLPDLKSYRRVTEWDITCPIDGKDGERDE